MGDITSRVAVAYENLQRGRLSKLDSNKIDYRKRELIKNNIGISYCKKSDNEFIIYVALSSYIMKVNGDYYQFGCIPVGNLFRLQNDFIKFTGPPKIIRNSYYHHPFVYEKPLNKICFGGDDTNGRWGREDLNICWDSWYKATDKQTIHRIAKWLDEGRFVIEEGYFGDWAKVHSLSRDSFSSEYRTHQIARTSGIRIVEPPKKQQQNFRN